MKTIGFKFVILDSFNVEHYDVSLLWMNNKHWSTAVKSTRFYFLYRPLTTIYHHLWMRKGYVFSSSHSLSELLITLRLNKVSRVPSLTERHGKMLTNGWNTDLTKKKTFIVEIVSHVSWKSKNSAIFQRFVKLYAPTEKLIASTTEVSFRHVCVCFTCISRAFGNDSPVTVINWVRSN